MAIPVFVDDDETLRVEERTGFNKENFNNLPLCPIKRTKLSIHLITTNNIVSDPVWEQIWGIRELSLPRLILSGRRSSTPSCKY